MAVMLFALIFKKRFTELLTIIFVRPLLNSLDSSNLVIDVIFILVIKAGLYNLVYKAVRRTKLSPIFILWSGVIAFLYLFYRFPKNQWFVLTPFSLSFLSHVYLADVLLTPIAGIGIHWVVKQWLLRKPVPKASGVKGFITDAPIVLKNENDELDRYGAVVELHDRILATETAVGSFAVAINGKWGSGKTSFIQTLEQTRRRSTTERFPKPCRAGYIVSSVLPPEAHKSSYPSAAASIQRHRWSIKPLNLLSIFAKDGKKVEFLVRKVSRQPGFWIPQ